MQKFYLKSVSSLIVRGLGAVSSILFTLAVTNSLNKNSAGVLFLGITWVTVLATICRFGFDNVILREVANDKNSKIVKKTYLSISLATAGIMSLICIIVSDLLLTVLLKNESNSDFSQIFIILNLAIIPTSLLFLVSMDFQAKHKTFISITINNILTFLSSALLITIFSIDNPFDAAVIYVACAFSVLVFAIWLSKPTSIKRNIINFSALNSQCFSFWIISIAAQATTWSGQIILGFFAETEAIAFFSVSQRLCLLISFILMAINMIVAPYFSKFYNSNELKKLQLLFFKSIALTCLGSLPIFICFILFPEYILSFFGSEYREASIVLQILAVGQLFNAITGPVGYLLSMTGEESKLRQVSIVIAVTNIGLLLLVVPSIGLLGAAIVTALVTTLQNLFNAYLVIRKFQFSFNIVRNIK